MKFNPFTGTLWDDTGRFLKKVECPMAATLADVQDGCCRHCQHSVLAMSEYAEDEIIAIILDDPHTCLSFSVNTPYLEIVPHDPSSEFS